MNIRSRAVLAAPLAIARFLRAAILILVESPAPSFPAPVPGFGQSLNNRKRES